MKHGKTGWILLLFTIFLFSCSDPKKGIHSQQFGQEENQTASFSAALGESSVLFSSDPEQAPSPVPDGSERSLKILFAYSKEELDLPQNPSEYVWMVDEQKEEGPGDKPSVAVGAYANLEGRMERMGSYLVLVDGSAVYKMDVITGEYLLLPSPEKKR